MQYILFWNIFSIQIIKKNFSTVELPNSSKSQNYLINANMPKIPLTLTPTHVTIWSQRNLGLCLHTIHYEWMLTMLTYFKIDLEK